MNELYQYLILGSKLGKDRGHVAVLLRSLFVNDELFGESRSEQCTHRNLRHDPFGHPRHDGSQRNVQSLVTQPKLVSLTK